jgi:hypothetical protein
MIPETIPPNMIHCTAARFDKWWNKNVLGLPERMPTSFWCYGCKRNHPEKVMEIYDVRNDAYYCTQEIMDKTNGIKRDKQGFVIIEE